MTLALFYLFGAIAIAGGVAMILSRNPVYGAIYLIFSLIAIAGEFLMLNAPFLAVLQVLVYAGAVMVLYLFVIMLLNLGHDPGFRWWSNWRTYVGLALNGLVGAAALQNAATEAPPAPEVPVTANVQQIATRMFGDPLMLFLIEALGVLLLIAVIAAVYLGRRSDGAEEAAARQQRVTIADDQTVEGVS